MNININGQCLQIEDKTLIVEGSGNIYTVNFTFSEEWEGFEKLAVFKSLNVPNAEPVIIAIIDGVAKIPAAPIRQMGRLLIGVCGATPDATMPTVWSTPIVVARGAAIVENLPEMDPNIWQQYLAILQETKVVAENAITEIRAQAEETLRDADEVMQTARESAQESAENAQTAIDAANASNSSAESASTSASNASESASAAAQAKSDAESASTSASTSATNAQNSASNAQESAESAEESAQVARDAIANIGTAKTDALNAIDAKVTTALNDIETSRAEAVADVEEAAAEIVADRAQIAINTADIAQLKGDIQQQAVAIDNRIKKFYTSNLLAETVNDSDDGAIRDAKIYGKGEQAQYTGKNLIPTITKSQSVYGVTFTKHSDGSITINGTSTAAGDLKGASVAIETVPGQLYTLSLGNAIPSGVWISINSGTPMISNGGSRKTDVLPSATNKYLYIFFNKDVTFNNCTVYPMLNEGSTALPYEPYVGGIPSPSPQYPQEIKAVVNPKVEVTGKNLFDMNTAETVMYNDVLCVKQYYESTVILSGVFKPKTKYTLSYDVLYKADAGGSEGYFTIVYTDGTIDSLWTLTLGHGSISSNPTKDIKSIRYNGWSAGRYCYIANIQIEEGEESTQEAYKETSATLTGITLNAIPVASGGNVTIDGQEYVADYVDEARGVIVRNVAIATLKSSQITGSGANAKGEYYADITVVPAPDRSVPECLCTTARYLTDPWNRNGNMIQVRAIADQIRIYQTVYSTRQEAEDYFDANTVYVVYKRATPTEESIAPEILEQLRSLRSYYGTTNVFVTSEQLDGASEFLYPCSIENFVEYVKEQTGDTRKFIYDMADIADRAYIDAQYAEILAQWALE